MFIWRSIRLTYTTPQKEHGYRNGQLLITAEQSNGGTTAENVAWTNVVGVTVSGNSLTKTAATAWGNAGAASTRAIVSGDGYVEFSVTSLLTGMVALSHTDTNQDYTTMEFALLPNSDGNLNVFESGVNRGIVSSYTTADRFRIAVEGGVVKYHKNGTLVYTSTVAPTYPLLVDAGLYHNGGTQSNVVISGNLSGTTAENVAWTNVVGATVSGNSLTKTASTAWGNAGAASTKSIVSGDGYVEFSVTSLLTGMVALSHTDTNQDYTTMEFALLPNSDGNLNVFESGVNRGIVSTYTTADRFRVAVEGGVVKYHKNGTLVYTSTVPPTYPLLVDAGLYHNGGTQANVVISGNLGGGGGGGGSGGGGTAAINWLVTDQLGTPRMVFDQSGSLATTKRHDYLPFGEELFGGPPSQPGPGGRLTTQGYTGDNLRQKFTQKERDIETGLDYFLARYYSSTQGRFTSPDEFKGGPHELWVLGSGHPEKQALVYAEVTNPQSLNKYQYCFNNPLRYVDPDGQNPQDSFEIRMQQAIRDVNSGRITPAQYWERLRGAGVGAAAGVAAILAVKAGMAGLTAAALWATRNPQAVQQIAQELVQASSGSPASANLGTPLTSVFNVERNALTSGNLLFGSLKNAEVAAQFSKSGDTLVAGIAGVFNKTEGLTGSSIKSLVNSVKDFARQEGLGKVELQAIGVINKDLEKRLLQQGFQRTTVLVDGEKVDALTKTIRVR